jgi:hypothetical protein
MQADLDANTRDYRGDIEMVELLLSMYKHVECNRSLFRGRDSAAVVTTQHGW